MELKVGAQIRLAPALPGDAEALRWQTIRSISPSFVQLDAAPGELRLAGSTALVSRRMLEKYIAEGRVEVRTDPAACLQCAHAKAAHRLYYEDGDDEPWSWCDECGGRCEFMAAAPPTSWLLAQAAAAMVGMGFRALLGGEEAS